MMASTSDPFADLPAFDPETDDLNVIIETPKGCRNKYKYDAKHKLFTLSKVLPAGSTFPYDFGYIPSTEGQDGDPLDVLLLMDEPAFSGCLIPARLIGVIRAEQHDKEGKMRNDRLIAIASQSHDQRDIRSLDEINPHLIEEIEHFFVSYNELEGKQFVPEARLGPSKARKIVVDGLKDSKSASNHASKTKAKAKAKK